MHFRDRGHIVQIIRTVYDPDTKKGKNEIVGRLVKAKPQMSDELSSALSKDEKKEVTTWIEGAANTDRLKRELAVRTLPEQLGMAEEWFKDKKDDDSRLLAATLFRSWVSLRVILKKNDLIE